MNSPSLNEMLETIGAVAARTWEVTEDSGKKALTEAEMKSRADEWANEAGVGGRTAKQRGRCLWAHRVNHGVDGQAGGFGDFRCFWLWLRR